MCYGRWTLGGGGVSVFSELCMRAICFVCGIEGVASSRLHMVYMHIAGRC